MNLSTTFPDLSNPAVLRRVPWSTTPPRWRRPVVGLCLEGICSNTQCEAYSKQVIMGMGYIQFHLVRDANASTCQCPLCNSWVQPTTCAFNKCRWRWFGFKHVAAEEPPTPCYGEWRDADDAYHCFHQEGSGSVQWRQLILIARPV